MQNNNNDFVNNFESIKCNIFYILVLIELAKLLKEHDLFMPEEIHFQLDNCGENKVTDIYLS